MANAQGASSADTPGTRTYDIRAGRSAFPPRRRVSTREIAPVQRLFASCRISAGLRVGFFSVFPFYSFDSAFVVFPSAGFVVFGGFCFPRRLSREFPIAFDFLSRGFPSSSLCFPGDSSQIQRYRSTFRRMRLVSARRGTVSRARRGFCAGIPPLARTPGFLSRQ
ncbi:MAG: hypothetical protein LBR80_02250 [Deltaproteobacteria bacterium]|jgi:hypothetical protein|nr:hypothetical protein [Deltaproteobacteria bacterium]